MARYCQIARLLPAADEVDADDVAAVAEAKIVLAELAKVQTEMDATLLGRRKSADA